MDGLVHSKQSMGWDILDKETSMVGAERLRKGEEGGSQRRERQFWPCGPRRPAAFCKVSSFKVVLVTIMDNKKILQGDHTVSKNQHVLMSNIFKYPISSNNPTLYID